MSNLFVLLLFLSASSTLTKKYDKEKPEWAKKDIRDFSDADMERLDSLFSNIYQHSKLSI